MNNRNGLYARAPNYAGGGMVPASNYGYGGGSGGGSFSPQALSGLGSLASGLFMDSGAPYDAYSDQLSKYLQEAKGVQNPFYNAGTGAIPKFQSWLDRMQNPDEFINNLMSKYNESPAAKYRKQQAMRAGINFGSANGLSGSTPLLQQMQQNAANISSEDMNSWLQNVLGINTQYGQGYNSLIGTGANSANALTSLLADYGKSFGEAAYGKEAGGQQDTGNIIGGILSLAGAFL
jgi:hypothetical protein